MLNIKIKYKKTKFLPTLSGSFFNPNTTGIITVIKLKKYVIKG